MITVKNAISAAPGLVRGPRPQSEADLNFLLDHFGVGAIVSVESGIGRIVAKLKNLAFGWLFGRDYLWVHEEKTALEKGLGFWQIGFDNLIPPTPYEAMAAVERVSQFIGEGKVVYLHCFVGKDRTGMIAALYRLLIGVHPGAQEAYEYWCTTRHRRYFFWRKRFFECAAKMIEVRERVKSRGA